ncbi:RNA transcription, translation and transport factor protein-like isoform X2 [Paramacrobiotus metropolitanus]|uniref:RNA transcription, translation and transport factor protein-like isoform X2 n=1 Tax=Paramacrobiotus metropolitanus TaxID=2943436 RepID=UPI0024464755|nr:RNA transcription, translation and transport factor protein-like isoform X2 [Paramacrobiotus metropolitanus]
MTSRKLKAVGYTGDLPVDLEDPDVYTNVLSWLIKDKRLQSLVPEARNKFITACENGLTVALDEERTDWLLRQLVSRECKTLESRFRVSHNYENVSICKGDGAKFIAIEGVIPKKHPLDNMNENSQIVQAGLQSLAKMLHIFPAEDRSRVLEMVVQRLETLSQNGPVESNGEHGNGATVPLDAIPLGFAVGDSLLENAMKVVRLLHIEQLRDLQTRMDEVLVLMQEITANPQTDERLGKIGR